MKRFLLLIPLIAIVAEARDFTDIEGRTIDAKVLSVENDSVKLELSSDGATYDVPLARLSAEDREFLKDWKPAEPEANPSPDDTSGGKDTSEKDLGRTINLGGTEALMKEYNLTNNYDDEWPKRIESGHSVEIKTVEEDEAKKRYVYHSPNYEFICDVPLSKNVLNKFSALFEATREFCRILPISTMKAHVPGEKFRNQILLFETKQSYVKNGGPPTSAGVFMPRGNNGAGVVMAPLTSLGVKKVGSRYAFDYEGSNKTLPHEIAHQLTDPEYFESGPLGWFSEGLAEYIAVTSYRSGKFMVSGNLREIKAYATEFGEDGNGGRNLGEEFTAPDLKGYMLQPYSSFTANGNFNYGLGLLITYYFFHWDGEGDRANITAFLKALKEGKRGEESLNVLLAGRTWDELEKAINKAWRSRGVKINFK